MRAIVALWLAVCACRFDFAAINDAGAVATGGDGARGGDALSGPTVTRLYAPLDFDKIRDYQLDPATGMLTLIETAVLSTQGEPAQIAFTPDGRFAYASYSATGAIGELAVDPMTGALTELAGSPMSDADTLDPGAIAVDPSGHFLLLASLQTGVASYAIDGTTGALTFVSNVMMTAPSDIVFDPSGRYAYVSLGDGSGGVAAFTLDGTGTLSALPGSPFELASGSGAEANHLAFDPAGPWLFATDDGKGMLLWAAFDASTGALTARPNMVTFGSGLSYGCAFTPDGSEMFVALPVGIQVVAIDPTTGVQTTESLYSQSNAIDLVADPTGRYFYVTDLVNGIFAYALIANDSLSLIVGSPVAGNVYGDLTFVVAPAP